MMYSFSSTDILGWFAGLSYAKIIQIINQTIPTAPKKKQIKMGSWLKFCSSSQDHPYQCLSPALIKQRQHLDGALIHHSWYNVHTTRSIHVHTCTCITVYCTSCFLNSSQVSCVCANLCVLAIIYINLVICIHLKHRSVYN